MDEHVFAERIQRDPVWLCENILGFHPWSKQRSILESVRDHPKVAVQSCHGVGKTAIAARVVLWFLLAHPGSCRVVTTAPTWTQVKDLLWREINTAVRKSRYPLGLQPLQTRVDIADDWFAVGLASDPNRAEHFQGHHADHLLFVGDEASGIDERIYEAAEGFQTAEGAKMLLIGNPTQLAGTFHAACTGRSPGWQRHRISAFDSPNLTGEVVPPVVARALPRADWPGERAAEWGEDDPRYQVRVLGEFPTTADDTIISLRLIHEAQERFRRHVVDAESEWDDEQVISCDVARFGSDETVIALRTGWRVRILESYTGQDLMVTAGKLKRHAGNYPSARVVVDDTGLGGGVTDRLREQGIDVEAFIGGERAVDPDEYPNRRSEAWFYFADVIDQVSLDTDEQLSVDLAAPKYQLDSASRRVAEPKKDTKKRLGRSPDRADAVLMAFAPRKGGYSWGANPLNG